MEPRRSFAATLIVTLLYFLVVPTTLTQAVAAYWWYENATCINEHTIKGTSHLTFDDSSYSSWDTTEAKYYGGCFYFKGGLIDLDSWDFNNMYNFGDCVTCGKLVGCSSDGTCDNFMTYPPSQQPSSKSSKSSSFSSSTTSTYQLSNPATGIQQGNNLPRLANVAARLQQKALLASHSGSVVTSASYASGKEQDPIPMTRWSESLEVVASGVVIILTVLVLLMRLSKYIRGKLPALMDVAQDHDGSGTVLQSSQQDYYNMEAQCGKPQQQQQHTRQNQQ